MDGNGDDARIRGGHGRRAVWVVAASGAPWIGGVDEGALDASLPAPVASGAPWMERVEEGALHLSLSVLVESSERELVRRRLRFCCGLGSNRCVLYIAEGRDNSRRSETVRAGKNVPVPSRGAREDGKMFQFLLEASERMERYFHQEESSRSAGPYQNQVSLGAYR